MTKQPTYSIRHNTEAINYKLHWVGVLYADFAEKFANYNPYHYCYNNPISFKDPTTGFAPEKEDNELQGKKKKVDKLQLITYDYDMLAARDNALEELYYKNCFALMNGYSLESYQKSLSSDWSLFGGDYSDLFDGSWSGGGGNLGNAITRSNNARNAGRLGQNISYSINDVEIGINEITMNEIMSNIQVDVSSEFSPEKQAEIRSKFWENTFKDINYVSYKVYYYLTTANIHVDILTEAAFNLWEEAHGYGRNTTLGWTSVNENFDITLIFNANNILNGIPANRTYFSKGINYTYQNSEVIHHEFGHGFCWFYFGKTYRSFTSEFKESWATDYTNHVYRNQANRPFEDARVTSGHYLCRCINYIFTPFLKWNYGYYAIRGSYGYND